MEERKVPKYLIQVQKQTAMTGEVITISGNLPEETTEEELKAEVMKMAAAVDHRLDIQNADVMKRTGGRMSLKDADMAAAVGVPVDELFPKPNGRDN